MIYLLNLFYDMKPMHIIFVGAIFVVIGGIIGAIGTLKQNKSSSIKSDKQLAKIQELNDQNARLSENISKLSEQNVSLISELTNARKDVDNARQESLDNTFGSTNGILVLGSSCLKLYNDSKLPMYDVKMFVTNYDALLTCERGRTQSGEISIKSSCYHAVTKKYTCGIIYGKEVFDLADFNIDLNKSFKISAKIICKKGSYYEQFIYSVELGSAYRILKREDPNYWNQYLDKNPDKPQAIKNETFKVVTEKSLRKDPVDWDKEFPLPVSYVLF